MLAYIYLLDTNSISKAKVLWFIQSTAKFIDLRNTLVAIWYFFKRLRNLFREGGDDVSMQTKNVSQNTVMYSV